MVRERQNQKKSHQFCSHTKYFRQQNKKKKQRKSRSHNNNVDVDENCNQ